LIEIRTIDEWLIQKRLPNGILTLDGLLLTKEEVMRELAQNPHLNLCISILDTYISKCGPRYHYQDWRGFIQAINMEDALNPQDNKVYVSTMHKSKGKQFDHVYLLLENFKLDSDEQVRLLYVAATRAKNTLVIHENGGLFTELGLDLSIHREKDLNSYTAPIELEMELSLGDVQLDMYNNQFTMKLMNIIKTGDELHYGEISFANGTARGLNVVGGRNLILFSKRFQEKLLRLESMGYKIAKAKVAYVVFWYNEKLGVECKVPLARIGFEKE
jgi:ATP-dependent DNA helicase RecQ